MNRGALSFAFQYACKESPKCIALSLSVFVRLSLSLSLFFRSLSNYAAHFILRGCRQRQPGDDERFERPSSLMREESSISKSRKLMNSQPLDRHTKTSRAVRPEF